MSVRFLHPETSSSEQHDAKSNPLMKLTILERQGYQEAPDENHDRVLEIFSANVICNK